MLVFWAGVGRSHPAESKAIGIQSYTEKALFKKGELRLPRYVSPIFLVSQKLKFSCSQYKVQLALLTAHPSTTPFITD